MAVIISRRSSYCPNFATAPDNASTPSLASATTRISSVSAKYWLKKRKTIGSSSTVKTLMELEIFVVTINSLIKLRPIEALIWNVFSLCRRVAG